jgi:hypothetical protein
MKTYLGLYLGAMLVTFLATKLVIGLVEAAAIELS